MPCLTSCCCGFSVKAGTRAIAILSVVYSVLGLLMVGTFNLERDRLFEQQVGGWPAANTNPSFHGVVEPGQHDLIPRVHDPNLDWPQHGDNDIHMHTMSNDELKEYEKRKRLELIMSVYAISVSVNFLVSLSLLAGVKLEKRWLLLPWVAWNSLSLIMSQMAVLYAPNKTMSSVPDIFTTGISIYCIMCVYSYFQVLSEERTRGGGGATLRTTAQLHASWTQPRPQLLTAFSTQGPDAGAGLSQPPLTVSLPPDTPPSYQSATDTPPNYDPPPPYPGSPQDKKTLESQDTQSTSNKDENPTAENPNPTQSSPQPQQPQNEFDKNVP